MVSERGCQFLYAFPKSLEKVKVEIKGPMHIYIILAIRWYHLQSWNLKNQHSYGCHKVTPVTEMFVIGNLFYVLKRSKKKRVQAGTKWPVDTFTTCCPLRTYIPKKIENLGSIPGPRKHFPKKNEYKCFSSFPKSPEKVKVEIKVPMHIYIILAIRWYHLQSWNSKNQYSYGCHKVTPVTEMYIIGNSFYVLKRSKKGQSWNQRDSGHVRHLGCPLRTYIPKKLKIWAALRGLGITFQKKKK